MAFMMKKKKYKFHVELCIEELIEVPFVSAVLFAKVRLLDGGNFQDQSSREEVKEHTVRWNAKFEFPCKMCANASTGVLEACVVRVSVRKECKGGRSFQKLGFCDLNLAEFAGSGLSTRKCLLEGYDARRRQDNSMLRLTIRMNMLQGDILFKVPSPSLKTKAVSVEEGAVTEARIRDDFSSGSLAGSIASGSSGFGSLPKKRPALFNSELLTGPVVDPTTTPAPSETTIVGTPVMGPPEPAGSEPEEIGPTEPGHSRNSSSTSQMSRASGYSSINSHSQHSRQSSSGDSGHIRYGTRALWAPTLAGVAPFSPASPRLVLMDPKRNKFWAPGTPTIPALAASILQSQNSSSSSDIFATPETTVNEEDLFIRPMTTVMEHFEHIENQNTHQYETNTNRISQYNSTDYNMKTLEHLTKNIELDDLDGLLRVKNSCIDRTVRSKSDYDAKRDLNQMKREYEEDNSVIMVTTDGVIRSKSDFEIPKKALKSDGFLQNLAHKSDNLFQNIGFLTPLAKRRSQNLRGEMVRQSTPVRGAGPTEGVFRVPGSPILRQGVRQASTQRAISLNSLKSYAGDTITVSANHLRNLPHRKLLEGGGKLATVATSPDESDPPVTSSGRRPSIVANPSSGSLALSETGSLDRAKAALERRKKAQAQEPDVGQVSGRVEVTRVNPDNLIAELLKNTNLEQSDEIAETSGLQLFIAKDGTAALGNHEVKSQMTAGAQLFKQVVMDNNRIGNTAKKTVSEFSNFDNKNMKENIESIKEKVSDTQTYIVNTRKRYKDVIAKFEEQNKNIELKLLENVDFRKDNFKNNLDINIILPENIANDLKITLDKRKVSEVQEELKNLEKLVSQKINKKNCELFKHLN